MWIPYVIHRLVAVVGGMTPVLDGYLVVRRRKHKVSATSSHHRCLKWPRLTKGHAASTNNMVGSQLSRTLMWNPADYRRERLDAGPAASVIIRICYGSYAPLSLPNSAAHIV